MERVFDGSHPDACELHRILSTSISIFDSAITLLGDPMPEGVQLPGPAHIACIRSILASLGIGDEEEEDPIFS